MTIQVLELGSHELWRGDKRLSNHPDLISAGQAALADAQKNGPGLYRIRQPDIEVDVTKAYGVLSTAGQNVTPPSTPSGLTLISNVTGTISFAWTASVAGSNTVAGYQVYRNGVPIASPISPSYVDNTVTPGQTYQYQVSAHDSQGNNSPVSQPLTVVAAAVAITPPSWSAIPASALITNTAFQLDLSSYVTPGSGAALTYAVVSGGLPAGITLNTATGRVSGTATAVGSFSTQFSVSDGSNAPVVSSTAVFNVKNPDTTAPSVPTGLAAVASTGQIALTWHASTDTTVTNAITSGVKEYLVRRNGSLISTIQAPGNPVADISYTDGSLGAGVTNSYTVSARDNAGNESAQSSAAVATTPAVDNTAPSAPASAPTLVGKTSTTVMLALPLLTDPTVSGQYTSGMKDYLVKAGGSIVGSPVAQPGSSATLGVGVVIGSPALAGSDSNANGTYTIICGGDQWTGSADQFRFMSMQVVGDFDIQLRFVSLSSSYDFSDLGFCVRNGTDPSAQYAALQFQGSHGFTVDYRSVAGAAASWSQANYAHGAPYYGRITRAGNLFSFYLSLDGVTWGAPVFTVTVAMPSAVLVGAGVSSQSAGVTATGVVDSMVVNSLSTVIFTDTFQSSASPSARSYTYAGRDNAGNISAYSAALSVTPDAATSQVKHHPGHYMLSNEITRSASGQTSNKRAEQSVLLASGANVVGYAANYTWDVLEPSKDNYDFSQIDADIAACGGKRFIIGVQHVYTSNHIPSYIRTNSTYGASPTGGEYGYWTSYSGAAFVAAIWRAAVMDRWKALFQALGAYYNGNTLVEALIDRDENAFNLDGGSDYSIAGYRTQFQALAAAAVAACPNTHIILQQNYQNSGSIQDDADILQDKYARRVGVGGPDIFGYSFSHSNPNYIWAQGVYMGVAGTTPGTDYRGYMPCIHDIQNPELLGSLGPGSPYTPQDIFNFANGDLRASHMLWNYLPGTGTGNWTGGSNSVLAMINANPVTNTAYPAGPGY